MALKIGIKSIQDVHKLLLYEIKTKSSTESLLSLFNASLKKLCEKDPNLPDSFYLLIIRNFQRYKKLYEQRELRGDSWTFKKVIKECFYLIEFLELFQLLEKNFPKLQERLYGRLTDSLNNQEVGKLNHFLHELRTYEHLHSQEFNSITVPDLMGNDDVDFSAEKNGQRINVECKYIDPYNGHPLYVDVISNCIDKIDLDLLKKKYPEKCIINYTLCRSMEQNEDREGVYLAEEFNKALSADSEKITAFLYSDQKQQEILLQHQGKIIDVPIKDGAYVLNFISDKANTYFQNVCKKIKKCLDKKRDKNLPFIIFLNIEEAILNISNLAVETKLQALLDAYDKPVAVCFLFRRKLQHYKFGSTFSVTKSPASYDVFPNQTFKDSKINLLFPNWKKVDSLDNRY